MDAACSAINVNALIARSVTTLGADERSTSSFSCLKWRPCGCGVISKSTFLHAMSPRFTSAMRTPTPSIPNDDGSARSHSASRPTSRSAPNVMSPEIPLNGSRMPTFMMRFVSYAVRRTAAGVEDDHFRVVRYAARCNQLFGHGQCAAALGRGVDTRRPRKAMRTGDDRLLAHGERVATAFTQCAEDQPVA